MNQNSNNENINETITQNNLVSTQSSTSNSSQLTKEELMRKYNISEYVKPRKKMNPIFKILIIVILIIGGVYIYKKDIISKFTNKINETFQSEKMVSKVKENLIGTWNAITNDETFNTTIIFDKDNSFHIYGFIRIKKDDGSLGTRSSFDGTGKYNFNIIGSKIKAKYDNSDIRDISIDKQIFEEKYKRIKIEKDELILDGKSYKKMAINNSIVGKWYWTKEGKVDQTVYYQFNEDGTGSYTVYGTPINLNYKTEDNILTLTFSGVNYPKENEYKIENNKLSIFDGVFTTVFYRAE